MDEYLEAAIEQARLGRDAGGIPIGSVLVIDGKIVGRGHNQRVQKGSATLHAEMDCLENAGRLKASDYARATLYSTLDATISLTRSASSGASLNSTLIFDRLTPRCHRAAPRCVDRLTPRCGSSLNNATTRFVSRASTSSLDGATAWCGE